MSRLPDRRKPVTPAPPQTTDELLGATSSPVAEATSPQVAEAPKPEPVKFTVHGADPELVKQIRHLAVDTGRTIGDLSNEGWRYVLAQHGKGTE